MFGNPMRTNENGSDPHGTTLSAFVREQGIWIIESVERSPYVAQRNTGEIAKR